MGNELSLFHGPGLRFLSSLHESVNTIRALPLSVLCLVPLSEPHKPE